MFVKGLRIEVKSIAESPPYLPKRSIVPPFGILFLSLDKQSEGSRACAMRYAII